MEKTRSLENLHELRLMALLLDVIREKGRMEAADLLGVNYKTLASRLLKNYWAGRHHLGDSDKRNNHQEYRCSRDLMTRYSRTSSCS